MDQLMRYAIVTHMGRGRYTVTLTAPDTAAQNVEQLLAIFCCNVQRVSAKLYLVRFKK